MEKKKNILMIGSDLSVKGGIISVVNQMLGFSWADKGVSVEYIPTHIDGKPMKKLSFFWKHYKEIKRKLKSQDIAVVHIHMSYKGSFYRKYFIHKLCKKYNKKDIIHLHGSEFKKFYENAGKTTQKWIRNMLKDCTCMIALGEAWETYLKSIEPEANIKVLYNAIAIPEEKVLFHEEEFPMLFLGALIKRKGIFELADAMEQLKHKGILEKYKVKLTIGGVGQEEETIKNVFAQKGLNPYVAFAGWVVGEKKNTLLKNSQLFVLPSHNEGLPIAILEAISYGLPVVSTNVGSIAEAVRDGENGYLVEPENVNALAEALEKAIKSKEKWEMMSANAKRIVCEKFDEKEYYQELWQLYEEMIEK